MKKAKDVDGMMITESSNRLSVFNSGVYDVDGRELVVACGYTIGGKFGYFICKEQIMLETYLYSDVYSFYPKESEKTYAKVLEEMKLAVKSYGGQLK